MIFESVDAAIRLIPKGWCLSLLKDHRDHLDEPELEYNEGWECELINLDGLGYVYVHEQETAAQAVWNALLKATDQNS